MTHDQKQGLLICIIAITLAAIVLTLSDGWGSPAPLSLYTFSWERTGPVTEEYCTAFGRGLNCKEYSTRVIERTWEVHFTVHTKYVLSFLLAVLGYGVLRFTSVVPDLFGILLLKLKRNDSPGV